MNPEKRDSHIDLPRLSLGEPENVSRRHFLQGAALTGAATALPSFAPSAQAEKPPQMQQQLPNPIVPNFEGEY